MNINYVIHYVHRDFVLKVNFRAILKMMVMHECSQIYFMQRRVTPRSITVLHRTPSIRKILKFIAVLHSLITVLCFFGF